MNQTAILSLSQLPKLSSFAAYLLSQKLEEFLIRQLSYMQLYEVPLLKHFSTLSNVQLLELSKQGITELLTNLSQNKAAMQLEQSLQQWKHNQLKVIDKDAITADDITLITYVRKKTMLDFVPGYTQNVMEAVELLQELDYFYTQSVTRSTNLFIDMLKERMDENAHLAQKVTDTIPGAVYVFDVEQYKGIYANNKLNEIIGYTQEELNALGPDAISSLVHPDDQAILKANFDAITASPKKEVVTKYRIKTKDGGYKWLANYEAVFKRRNNGTVWQTIGITLDVESEEKAVAKLQNREQQLVEAQQLARLGSYTWDVAAGTIEWSDEMFRIYELLPSLHLSYDVVLAHVHPDDKALFNRVMKEDVNKNKSYDFYYRIITARKTEKILHSRGRIESGASNVAEKVVGTDQDVTEKQRLIRSLSRSESLYKQAESLANMGNWSWDVHTRKLQWTDQLYRIYGLPPQSEDVTIDRFLSFIHPDDRAFVENGVSQLNSQQAMDYTFRIITPAGGQKWLRSLAQVIPDEQGNPHFIIGTEQDVTERQELIERLQQSEKLYKQAQSLTHMGNWTWDLVTNAITWSDEMFDIYEVPAGKPLTQAEWLTFLEPGDNERLAASLKKAIAEHKAIDITHKLLLRSGKVKIVHRKGELIFNKEGKPLKMIGTTQDITEQRQATETIKEQEHFIQQIADASPTILYLFDVEAQQIAYINHEAFFVLGYLPEELVEAGSEITTLLYHPDDLPLLPCRTQSAKKFQQTDSMIQYECRMRNKEGAYRWLLVREIVFKKSDDKNITQIIGAALDITRRKEMERTILQNTLQLQQSNASLEEFAYVASHDLKEPLRKISTFGDRLMLSHAANLSDEGKMYLSKIVDASQRMQNMITDLLSISLISGNRAFETTDLRQIFEDSLQTLEFKIEQQNALVTANELPEVKIIASQFRQLFQNLIANSLKFVRQGVQPQVHVNCVEVDAEDVQDYQLAKATFYYKLTFADNGIGFEEEYAQKIFSIFHRLHGRSEYEGSGIGLAICKKIAEHHGGVIFAKGRPGMGATFTVILPA